MFKQNQNIILAVDSYKYSHPYQLPAGTGYVNSYIESRGSNNPVYTATVFAGILPAIKTYLLKPVTMADIDEAESYVLPHGLPFDREGWEYIVNELDGKIPVYIEALPEGTTVEMSNALVQVCNTDPRVPWITAFIETFLLRAIWYQTTIATKSWTIKKMFLEYAEKSGSDMFVDFKLHDFGARGVSSGESAMLGGMGHLMIFQGTDTMEAIVGARKFYNIEMAGFSIPATEHSTTTIWGRNPDDELSAYENMIDTFAKPEALLAMVIDSYDREKAVEMISTKLKNKIIASGATIVLRPDSGDPVQEPIDTILQLMKYWGYETNDAGYKVLPSCIRVIQGDGITIDSIPKIIENLDKNKLALDNIAFGMGGGLLQQADRDVFKFAQKTSYAIVNGDSRNVSKNPVGDSSKRSKDGILDVYLVDGKYVTYNEEQSEQLDQLGITQLETVYKDGELLRDENFVDIRERVDYSK